MDQLEFRYAKRQDLAFIYEASKLIQSPALVSQNVYAEIFLKVIEPDNLSSDIWVVEDDNVPCGYILINYLSVLRYAGFCVEMEEVVILQSFQKKGIGKRFINFLVDHYRKISDCRQILVKTDDEFGAGKLYGSLMSKTEMKTYKSFLNKI